MRTLTWLAALVFFGGGMRWSHRLAQDAARHQARGSSRVLTLRREFDEIIGKSKPTL
jgi:hypothetical protein